MIIVIGAGHYTLVRCDDLCLVGHIQTLQLRLSVLSFQNDYPGDQIPKERGNPFERVESEIQICIPHPVINQERFNFLLWICRYVFRAILKEHGSMERTLACFIPSFIVLRSEVLSEKFKHTIVIRIVELIDTSGAVLLQLRITNLFVFVVCRASVNIDDQRPLERSRNTLCNPVQKSALAGVLSSNDQYGFVRSQSLPLNILLIESGSVGMMRGAMISAAVIASCQPGDR